MIKLDFRFDSQTAQIGPQFAVAFAFGYAHRLEHLDVTARRRKSCNADLIDCRDEGRGAAIMIGISGPSTSMTALSTPRPCNAARTCSVVDMAGPSLSPRTVANSVAVTERK